MQSSIGVSSHLLPVSLSLAYRRPRGFSTLQSKLSFNNVCVCVSLNVALMILNQRSEPSNSSSGSSFQRIYLIYSTRFCIHLVCGRDFLFSFWFIFYKNEAYAYRHLRGGFVNNFCLMLTGFEQQTGIRPQTHRNKNRNNYILVWGKQKNEQTSKHFCMNWAQRAALLGLQR